MSADIPIVQVIDFGVPSSVQRGRDVIRPIEPILEITHCQSQFGFWVAQNAKSSSSHQSCLLIGYGGHVGLRQPSAKQF